MAVRPTTMIRPAQPERLPTVLTQQEVDALLATLDGVSWIVAMVLYGSGLRLMECLRLRVKDIDFKRNEILVRQGKGNKDPVTMLAAAVTGPLTQHLVRVRRLHERDLKVGLGRVQLPDVLARKYPNADGGTKQRLCKKKDDAEALPAADAYEAPGSSFTATLRAQKCS